MGKRENLLSSLMKSFH
ncbi:hypothetical protein C5167_035625 [Papaver somniferum]|uniref:Uncharacterized protein n=1 Tax=Papaver somniferum TaxID=3469 RepID=A0A4Y7KIW2_PAPSO|nr:hypothetical protein C5167_035625 [Papaver somniferum]